MVKSFVPSTKFEALDILSKNDVTIVAGGTDQMVMYKNTAGLTPKFNKDVMFVSKLNELNFVKKESDGIHIGATTPLYLISENPVCPSLLKKCIEEVASLNLRHFATLAGNIANASPAGDTPVVEVCLNALIKLESKSSSRIVKAEDFVLGVRKIDRHPDEMITEIIFPETDFNGEMWYKVGSRKSESISKVSFAGAYKVENNILKDISIAFGSVFIKVARSHEIEDELKGMSLEQLKNNKDNIIEKYSHIISPIDDQRSNREYRMKVAMNICALFLDQIIKGGK